MNTPEDREVAKTPEGRAVVNTSVMEEMMDMENITVGSHIAVVYGRHWYIGKVIREVGDMYDVTYMTPSRGKWKWGRTDQGRVDKEDAVDC